MKTITLRIPQWVFDNVAEYARRKNRATADVYVEAIRKFAKDITGARSSLTELKPLDLGEAIPSPSNHDDVLGEMLK